MFEEPIRIKDKELYYFCSISIERYKEIDLDSKFSKVLKDNEHNFKFLKADYKDVSIDYGKSIYKTIKVYYKISVDYLKNKYIEDIKKYYETLKKDNEIDDINNFEEFLNEFWEEDCWMYNTFSSEFNEIELEIGELMTYDYELELLTLELDEQY